jgi:phytanoyl-CoA hydroxylase
MHFFGHLGPVFQPQAFFSRNDYIVCRGALQEHLVGEVIKIYEKTFYKSEKKFLRQSGRWETNSMHRQSHGVENCFLNPHAYQERPNSELSEAILELFSTPEIQTILKLCGDKDVSFNLYQTMLFDRSVTAPHQDWVYLDSKPGGHLIAAWIALEDIYPESIRFCVYPETQHFKPVANYSDVNDQELGKERDFVHEIAHYLKTSSHAMYAPSLRKGDIFFWGSRLIHGSTPGSDENLRRRSIAGHFVPKGFKFGNLRNEIEMTFANKHGLNYAIYPLDEGFVENN